MAAVSLAVPAAIVLPVAVHQGTQPAWAATTQKNGVGRILTMLGLRDRVQAVVLAYETGLVKPGG